jgi:hypothetical protein
MVGEVNASQARLAAQLADRDTKRMAQLDAMTYLERLDEVLSLDSEITSILRAIHKQRVERTYVGGVLDCDRQLWQQLDGRFLTLDYKADPT